MKHTLITLALLTSLISCKKKDNLQPSTPTTPSTPVAVVTHTVIYTVQIDRTLYNWPVTTGETYASVNYNGQAHYTNKDVDTLYVVDGSLLKITSGDFGAGYTGTSWVRRYCRIDVIIDGQLDYNDWGNKYITYTKQF